MGQKDGLGGQSSQNNMDGPGWTQMLEECILRFNHGHFARAALQSVLWTQLCFLSTTGVGNDCGDPTTKGTWINVVPGMRDTFGENHVDRS